MESDTKDAVTVCTRCKVPLGNKSRVIGAVQKWPITINESFLMLSQRCLGFILHECLFMRFVLNPGRSSIPLDDQSSLIPSVRCSGSQESILNK